MPKTLKFILLSLFIFVVFITSSYFYAKNTIPDTSQLESCFTTSMNKVYLCREDENYIRLHEISDNLVNAVIISEDVTFFDHNGFDVSEIKESFITNILRLKFARGASTITQQLSKNIYLSPEKSIFRKLRELFITQKLEANYSKEVILEKYLNVVQLGKDLYGIKAASEFYFSKHPSELTPVESAFLAYLLPSPIKYSKVYEKKQLTAFSRGRLADIIYRMHFFKKITDDEYEQSKLELSLLFEEQSEGDESLESDLDQ